VVPIGSATIGLQGDIYAADDLTIQFDGTGSFAGVIFGALNGAADKILKLTFNPATAPSTNRYRLYGANTVNSANILIDGYATANALYNGSVIAPYHGSGSQTYNGVISGNGGLVQRANGLTILNGQNTYSGGTTPTAGAIGFGADTTGAVDSGPIGTGPLYVAPELPNTTGTGTILASGGDRTIANPIQYPSATNNQTLRIGGTYALTLSGPVTLNGNDSTGTQTNRTFEVTNTALTTISGGISGAGFGLTKTGNGVLALTATESYTGPTAVSAGTLLVNGQLHAQSAVTVATNATLGGTGTINGSVTVSAGGILSPGSSIGTLTLGSLSTAGNLLIEVNKSAGQTSDRLSVSGTLANTGTGILTVTNLGGVAFAQGDTFPIFNKAMTGGGSLTITNFGGTFYWTNNLAVDGTITVGSTIPTIPTTPTDITATVADGSLNLSWPSSYVGWDLQSNSVAVDNAAMWFTVPGSASVSSMQLPISTTGNVFYRLHYLAP
jgi:autotransporter-associated beta strand protein